MKNLSKKNKKLNILPMPLILVILFVLGFIVWGYFSVNKGTKLTILHTNNLEGQITPFIEGNTKDSSLGGFSKIATVVNSIKSENNNVILFDSGDTIQGTKLSQFFSPSSIGELMSEIGYDAVTIGEHDFDKGTDGLIKYIKSASYPFLVSNIEINKTCELDKLIEPFIIIEKNNLKIGVIGVITEEANIYANTGDKIIIKNPKYFLNKYIDKLKPKTDIIIVLSHLGFSQDKELASSLSDIDIIIGGHSKTKLPKPYLLKNPKGSNTIIVQAQNKSKYLGQLDVSINESGVNLNNYKLIHLDSSIKENPKLKKEIDNIEKDLMKKAQETIGKTKQELNATKGNLRTSITNMGMLFTDSIQEKFPEVDVTLINSGGIRGNKIFPPGKITLEDLYTIHPFDNKVVIIDIKGKHLKEMLERSVNSLPLSRGNFLQVSSTLHFNVDLTADPQVLSEDNQSIKSKGNRVKSITINNKPINLDKTYKVAINDFIMSGGDGFISVKKASNVNYTNTPIRDILKEYIKKHSPLDIEPKERVIIEGGLLK